IRRGPRAKARRQRAASHISAIESGPPETARTIAGTPLQSANRRFASRAEIGELSSLGMAFGNLVSTSDQVRQHSLALNPLLLAVHGLFDAARGARIFPRHLAERRTGGFLLFQGRQRLSEPQQGVGGFRRFVELGGHAEEGFRGITVLLALEKTLAEPILRVGNQGIARVFLHEVAHGLFGQRIVLALHIADAEIELVPRRGRRRQGGQRSARPRVSRRRWRQRSRLVTRTTTVRQIERLARAASPGSANR